MAVFGSAIYALCTVASAIALQWVTDHVILPRFDDGHVAASTVVAGLSAIVLIGVIRAVGVVTRRSFAVMTQYRVAETLSNQVVDKVVTQPVPWHRRQTTGDLVSRVGVDVDASIAVLAPTPFATGVILMVFVSSVWLIVTDPVLGIAATLVFPALIAMNVLYQRKVDRFFRAAQDELGSLSEAVHESFDGVTVVKAFGAEQRETERLAVIASRLREARIGAVRLRSTFESLLDGVPNAVNIGLVLAGAYRVRSGAMSVGEMTSFVYLFTLLVFPLRLIGFALSELPHSQAGLDRVRAVIDEPIAPDPAAMLGRDAAGVQVRGLVAGHVSGQEVLRGVDLDVRPGTTVAVVGATGSGKTTLLHVLAGLVPLEAGSVDLPKGMSALVFQEPFLMAASVRENVTLGAPYNDDEVLSALATAEAQFVGDLPGGLGAELGERGAGLSGGQRQRVALARALVRTPAVLLLDDTTSALDPATEARVLANLRQAPVASTVIAVASRPSTIALADEVVYLRDGVVAAHGPHDQLMATIDGYRELMAAFESDRDADPSAPSAAGGERA
jgi:ABC-type multidrug transport system fused ATPase/permease subunit